MLLLVLLLGACSDPDADTLSALSREEASRFKRGRQLAVPCWTCHDLKGSVKKVGPSLVGIYGRLSGTAAGASASDALRAAAIEWDTRTLAAFLRDPARFVPGNSMVYPGIRDPAAVSDLLFYLQRVTTPAASR